MSRRLRKNSSCYISFASDGRSLLTPYTPPSQDLAAGVENEVVKFTKEFAIVSPPPPLPT